MQDERKTCDTMGEKNRTAGIRERKVVEESSC